MSAEAIPLMEAGAPASRHPGLDTVCARLEAILHGRAAADLLRDVRSIPERAGIVILPAWSWELPLIDVGRKDKAFSTAEGRIGKGSFERLLLPVRNDWSEPMVRLVSGGSVPVTYRSLGMGHQMAGQSKLITRPGAPAVARVTDVPSLADPVFVGESLRNRTVSELHRLVDAGNAARWELIRDIEPKLEQQMHVAHSAVSHEIGQTSGNVVPMLDIQGLEQVQNLMMFGEVGEDGSEKPGSVFRLIELCLTSDCFVKVDPLRYMVKHLRRDAETEIRRKIGDPHIGPKVRAVALKHPRAELTVIVDEYRKIYPKDRLSIPRAQAALSVRPDAMASCTQLMPETYLAKASEDLEGAMA
ncbi:MAG TPA: hypothetical protein VF867_19255 [Arthrobacter sp.]